MDHAQAIGARANIAQPKGASGEAAAANMSLAKSSGGEGPAMATHFDGEAASPAKGGGGTFRSVLPPVRANAGVEYQFGRLETFNAGKGATTGKRRKGRPTGRQRTPESPKKRKHTVEWLVNYTARVDPKDWVNGEPMMFLPGGKCSTQAELLDWAKEHVHTVRTTKIQPRRSKPGGPMPPPQMMNTTASTVAMWMVSHTEPYDPDNAAQREWDEDAIAHSRRRWGRYLIAVIGHCDSGHWHLNFIIAAPDPKQPVSLKELRLDEAHTDTPLPRPARAGEPLPAPRPTPRKRDSIIVTGEALLDSYHREVAEPRGWLRKSKNPRKRDNAVYYKVKLQVADEFAEREALLAKVIRDAEADRGAARTELDQAQREREAAAAARRDWEAKQASVSNIIAQARRATQAAEKAKADADREKAEAEAAKRTFTERIEAWREFLTEEFGLDRMRGLFNRFKDFLLRKGGGTGGGDMGGGTSAAPDTGSGLPPAQERGPGLPPQAPSSEPPAQSPQR